MIDLALLKDERIKRGVTQEKLAKYLGFKDKSSYCLIERGKISISVDIANQIAIYLGLSEEVTYKVFFASKVEETSTDSSNQFDQAKQLDFSEDNDS